MIAWSKTLFGARQRVWLYAGLLFRRIDRVPRAWLAEMYRLTRSPGFLDATLAAERTQIDLGGQREVLLDQLSRLTIPTLIVWGHHDRIVPYHQGQDALIRLPRGSFASIPDCGHLPQVERPDRLTAALTEFFRQ
jgi:pimeloyl-ACP methyl ester carboxylesterase